MPEEDLKESTNRLFREISNIESRLNEKIEGLKENAKITHDDYTRVPTLLDRAIADLEKVFLERISHLKDVTNEKFEAVNSRFIEQDLRKDQRAEDTKLAVDAAFAAAKEVTSKIEAVFTKQIDGIIEQYRSETRGLIQQISDLKDRVSGIENRGLGISSVGSLVIGGAIVIGVLVAFAGLLFGIFKHV